MSAACKLINMNVGVLAFCAIGLLSLYETVKRGFEGCILENWIFCGITSAALGGAPCPATLLQAFIKTDEASKRLDVHGSGAWGKALCPIRTNQPSCGCA